MILRTFEDFKWLYFMPLKIFGIFGFLVFASHSSLAPFSLYVPYSLRMLAIVELHSSLSFPVFRIFSFAACEFSVSSICSVIHLEIFQSLSSPTAFPIYTFSQYQFFKSLFPHDLSQEHDLSL